MEINLNEELDLSTRITPRASSGNFEKKIAGGSTGGYYVGVDWKVNSQSASSNSSNVTASVYIRSTGNGYTISSSVSKDISVTINGTKYTGTNTIGISTNTKKVLLTKTVTVGHNSDGTKSCSFACSVYVGFTLSGTSLGTVSASGTGTFNTINLNTAPVWVSGGRVTIKNGSTILTDAASGTENAVKFPENVSTLNLSWSGATDANGDTITYELYEQVSESSWTNIYTGTAKSYSRSIGGGASTQGKSYDYYVKAKDSKGVYASGSQDGTQVQKNTLTGSTLASSSSIAHNTTSIAFSWGAGSNTDGSAVKYDLTANGITVYRATNLTGTSVSVAIADTAPSSGAYILKSDLKSKFSSSSYNGTLSFTLTTKNNYGSTKTSSKTINIDLRNTPTAATPSIDKTTNSTALHTVASTGNKYFVPDGSKIIKVTWSGGSDYLGTTLKYDVQVKIGSSAYKTEASNLTATSYNLVLPKQTSSQSMVVRVITKTDYNYTNYKDTTAETLHYYNQPSVDLVSMNRTSTSATATIKLNANTSIPNVNFTTRSYSGASSGTLQNTKNNQNITANNLIDTSKYSWTIKVVDDVGLYTTEVSKKIEIPSYTPLFSVREKGVGVNAVPNGDANLMVGGKAKITQGFFVHQASAGGGTNGYLHIANVKVNGNYQNSPIEFKIAQRGKKVMPTLTLQLTNTNNTTPAVAAFSKDSSECNAWVKDSGSGSFDIYVQKTESYDNIGIVDFNKSNYMNQTTVTWKDALVESIPSGSTAASVVGSISLLQVYPVGSIYMSVNSTNPSSLFGGTWVAWGSGRVPVGINTGDGDFNTVEKTGGAKTHTLTVAQMPSHTHTQNSHNHTQNAHTHTQNAHTHSVRYRGFSGMSASSSGNIVLRRNDSADPYDGTDTDGAISATATNQNTTATNNATTATNQNTGGGGAHNNMQPYIVCYMWKRTA